ncbi:MAG: hypothetical protein HY296_06420 [Thaumarchaeota archaeon]|nr:hypothetical protein [Nitrososphaerota archaeon]
MANAEKLSNTEKIWRGATNDELLDAAARFADFAWPVEQFIRAELKRRGLDVPPGLPHVSQTEIQTTAGNRQASLNEKGKPKSPQWEIQLQDGTVREVFVASELFPEILSGAISGDLPCRDFPAPSKNGTTKNKKWSNIANKIGASGYEARLLFRPVWAHSLRGLQTGAILGLVFWLVMNIFNSLSAGIELRGLTDAKGHDLNTKFGAYAIACGYWLAQSIPMLAEVVPLAWIKNLGAFVAPRAFQAAAMCLFFLGMKKLDVLAVFAGLIPGMGVAFGAMIAGGLAGGPPGMMIGTIIGWARRSRLQTAPGWPREKLYSLLLKGVLLPTSISAVAVLIYIKYSDSLIEEVTKRFLQ